MFRPADVYAYDTSIKPIKNYPIVLGTSTLYADPADSRTKTFFLVHRLLDHTLINPNQVRAFGIPFWDDPYDNTTARSVSIDIDADLRIPLRAHGSTKLMFLTRVPSSTNKEEVLICDHIQMMSPHPWNPTKVFMLQATNQQGRNVSCPPWKRMVATVDSTYERSEYLNLASDDAWLDSIDPSLLVRIGERLNEVL